MMERGEERVGYQYSHTLNGAQLRKLLLHVRTQTIFVLQPSWHYSSTALYIDQGTWTSGHTTISARCGFGVSGDRCHVITVRTVMTVINAMTMPAIDGLTLCSSRHGECGMI
ncbi:hypothetical protein EVAR_92463_1 [Eumeta japonica]|uniref:Uncharacterized protein n=1 Tax=Eumeta variegata TaxID=151549 RepID=A0A4C1T6U9_EUMVA|nr:hypothetical protein EVAR_92463_1 [Eumeta japonica]